MTLRGLVLFTLLGSTLVAGFLRPPAASVRPTVDVGRTCSTATSEWAERWRQAASRARNVTRLTVVCRPDGAVAGARVDWRSTDGYGLAEWRPETTFGGDLPPRGRERINLVDGAGRLLGKAVLDRATGRLEFYRGAELAGYGRFDPLSGDVERFDLAGRRQTLLALPIPPSAPRVR